VPDRVRVRRPARRRRAAPVPGRQAPAQAQVRLLDERSVSLALLSSPPGKPNGSLFFFFLVTILGLGMRA
jgi:hypothetical protein